MIDCWIGRVTETILYRGVGRMSDAARIMKESCLVVDCL